MNWHVYSATAVFAFVLCLIKPLHSIHTSLHFFLTFLTLYDAQFQLAAFQQKKKLLECTLRNVGKDAVLVKICGPNVDEILAST